MQWKWSVGGRRAQEVILELGLLSGREVVRVDGETVVDQIAWRFRGEWPIELAEGRAGVVKISASWEIVPKCELWVDGMQLLPVSQPARMNPASWVVFIGLLVAATAIQNCLSQLNRDHQRPSLTTAQIQRADARLIITGAHMTLEPESRDDDRVDQR